VASLYQPLAPRNHGTDYRTASFGMGTGRGISPAACADGNAFGIGTGRGMSALTCADAAAIETTPKM